MAVKSEELEAQLQEWDRVLEEANRKLASSIGRARLGDWVKAQVSASERPDEARRPRDQST